MRCAVLLAVLSCSHVVGEQAGNLTNVFKGEEIVIDGRRLQGNVGNPGLPGYLGSGVWINEFTGPFNAGGWKIRFELLFGATEDAGQYTIAVYNAAANPSLVTKFPANSNIIAFALAGGNGAGVYYEYTLGSNFPVALAVQRTCSFETIECVTFGNYELFNDEFFQCQKTMTIAPSSTSASNTMQRTTYCAQPVGPQAGSWIGPIPATPARVTASQSSGPVPSCTNVPDCTGCQFQCISRSSFSGLDDPFTGFPFPTNSILDDPACDDFSCCCYADADGDGEATVGSCYCAGRRRRTVR